MQGEMNTIVWLIGGGMALLILREVFTFIKSTRKSNSDGSDRANGRVALGEHEKRTTDHVQLNAIEHALQLSCLQRLEASSIAQTRALIEVTTALERINVIEKR
jgi:hypothetical protein